MTALAAPRVPARQSAESPGEKHGVHLGLAALECLQPRADLVTAAEATMSAVHGAAASSEPAGFCHPSCMAAPRKGRVPGAQHPRLRTPAGTRTCPGCPHTAISRQPQFTHTVLGPQIHFCHVPGAPHCGSRLWAWLPTARVVPAGIPVSRLGTAGAGPEPAGDLHLSSRAAGHRALRPQVQPRQAEAWERRSAGPAPYLPLGADPRPGCSRLCGLRKPRW